MKRIIVLGWLLCSVSVTLHAQTNPTAQALPYVQDFSTLAHTATAYPAGLQGWTVTTTPGASFSTATPTADRALVASSSASVNSGNVHNYNGKIGFLNTGSLDLGLVLSINTTNKRNIKVAYDAMTIRNPYDTTTNSRINEMTLQYRLGTSGLFTTLTGIEYQNNNLTQTGSGVTAPQKLERRSIILPSVCDSEQVVQLRWVSRQVSGGGARPSFAIDDINIDTAGGLSLALAAGANALEGTAPVAGTFTFNFNPATIGSTTFDYVITGTATFATDYTVTLSGGATPTTLTTASGTITVPASVTSVTATVTPVNDALTEGAEKVIFKITNPTASYTITDSTKSITIIDDEATPIHTIQGTGMNATAGSYTIEAIVTGVYPTLSPAGFYVQEEDTDADTDPATSEGIFVVSSTTVAVGDKVRVAGVVQENTTSPSFQQAVIHTTTVSVLSNGNTLPTAVTVTLPVTAVTDHEKYECMLVRINDTLTVTDNYNVGRYGEINLSKGGMTYQSTQIVDPNDAVATGNTSTGASNVAAVNAYALSNSVRTILVDDGRGTIPTLPFVNSDNTLRLGSTVNSITGIMGFAFSVYRIQPVPYAAITFNYTPRPLTVPTVGTPNVRIASFNVLNYFNGNGAGGGFPTAGGAHSMAEFTRQRDKIINAIADINADVVGLIEIENDGVGSASAIQDLVNGLNTKMGANTYSIINDGANTQTYCTDAIRCGIIYKAAVVTTVGAAMLSGDTIFNRPPLAQTFALVSNGQRFNYIINHFKSKSCSGSTGADVDMLDGQSCFNDRRRQQATKLVDFVNNTVKMTSGSSMVLSMGDYNAYYQEDPLDVLRAANFSVLGSETSVSYLFSGLVGSLDNAVVSDSLLPKVTGVAKWNINSAEPTHLDYNDNINDGSGDFVNDWGNTYTTIPFRSSDHDPVIVGLDLSTPVTVKAAMGTAGIKVYPNPANAILYLSKNTGIATSWSLQSVAGQVLRTGSIAADEKTQQLDIAALPAGVYIMKLVSDNGASSAIRVIKQ